MFGLTHGFGGSVDVTFLEGLRNGPGARRGGGEGMGGKDDGVLPADIGPHAGVPSQDRRALLYCKVRGLRPDQSVVGKSQAGHETG